MTMKLFFSVTRKWIAVSLRLLSSSDICIYFQSIQIRAFNIWIEISKKQQLIKKGNIVKKILAAACMFLICLQPVLAADSAPTDASLMELMTVTKVQSLLASSAQQIDGVIRARVEQLLAGRTVSPEQKKILDDMRSQTVSLISSELKWDKVAPQYLDVYRKSFTQKEVDGMLAFYKTEAGQAVINKMPAVMQNSMQLVQNMLTTLMPKMEKIQKDGIAKLQAAGK